MTKSFGKIIFVLILILKSNCFGFGQSLKFSGYFADFVIYQKIKDDFAVRFGLDKNLFLNFGRIRLRPEFEYEWGGGVYVEYEIDALYNSSNLFFNFAEIGTRRQILKLRWNLANGSKFSTFHFIDRLYFKKDFGNLNLTLGRQRISWGTGRIWNPTDLFNPINPANFSKIEKDGADVVSVKFYLGSFTDIQFVYNPIDKFKMNNYGVRFRTNYHEFDFSFMSGLFDKRGVAGFDFAGNLFKAGVRGEMIFSADVKNFKSNFFKFILGFDNQFTKNIYGLVEYHFNGEGKSRKDEYEIERLINGEILNLSKNYVFVMLNYALNPIASFSASLNKNLNDGSGFISFGFSYSVSDNSDLNFGALIFHGDEGDEYWYYSTSAFVRFQFYF